MKNRKAFSMIELIFVVVILGILAAVSVPKLAEKQLGKDNVIVQVGAELRQEFSKIDCEGYKNKLTIQKNRYKELLAEIQELRDNEQQQKEILAEIQELRDNEQQQKEPESTTSSNFVPSYAPIGTSY